ncbi:MAG: SGNH/GDSL hydrolase family protein [Lachnospiraceae bacterium]|jgi:lysophospholipase L1-like esterase|nr:SGNH/GDSL hydrolase family protein [Lachnospiraceae bacterium]
MANSTNEIFILRDNIIEGSPVADGFVENYYLENRLAGQAKMMTPLLGDDFGETLTTVGGFCKLVSHINVSIATTPATDTKARFALTFREQGGFRDKWAATVPLNGEQICIEVATCEDNPAALASFQITFPAYTIATITLSLTLRENLPFPQMPPDKPIVFASLPYQQMIANSLISLGNLSRLQRAIAKARAGKKVTLAYIGGSITQGAGAKPINNMCYAKRATLAFAKRLDITPEQIHFIKAGIGGTPSQLGIARYHADITHDPLNPPDIVVIEFAVNDYADETLGVAYESLCLMAQDGPGSPAVVLLFSVFANDENLEERLVKVGIRHHFPIVSAKAAVLPQYDKDEDTIVTRRQYFHDILHPSNSGHQIMADALDYLWQAAIEAKPQEEFPPAAAIIGDDFRNMRVLNRSSITTDPAVISYDLGGFTAIDELLHSVERDDDIHTTPQFSDNWKYCGKKPEAEQTAFKMEIECKDLLLVYKDTHEADFAAATIFIDGVYLRDIDPRAAGWIHCGSTFIIRGKEKARHNVEIRPLGGANGLFTILAFGYT